MPISPHTYLINCLIGFCVKTDSWIHPLADLGYEPVLVEQSINLTQTPGQVKPDVVAYSNKQLNAIAFDCKGGISVNQNQLQRYQKLVDKDFFDWIECYNKPQFTHEVCIVDLQYNHGILSELIREFPILVLSENSLRKTGNFKKKDLDLKFGNSLTIEKTMVAPSSFYPFSELDDRGLIVKEVLRAIITILKNPRRRGFVVFDRATYQNDIILKTIHPFYSILGREHQDALRAKINDIIDSLRVDHPDFHKQVLAIRERVTDSDIAISNLIETCEDIMKKEERKNRLEDYYDSGE